MPDRLPLPCRHCTRFSSRRQAEQCPSSPARKNGMRKIIVAGLGSMSPEIRRRKSLAVARRIISCDAFQRARMIMAYVAMELEVDLWSMVREAWKMGKRIAMPRIVPPLSEPRIPLVHDRRILPYEIVPAEVDDPADHPGLQTDMLGIWEPRPQSRPVSLTEVDLVLVPALAYDRTGHRLGKGGGFYDRLLSSDGLQATTIGVAFREQIFASLPTCPHDHPIDMLITETETLACRSKN